MKTPLIRLREIHNFGGNAERIAAEYLLTNSHLIPECNIRELAAQIYVSPSTIVRLCKRLGFDGYREFRQAVVYELALHQMNKKIASDDMNQQDSMESVIEKITHRNIIALEETLNSIDLENFIECVQLISSAKHLLLFGIGASQCVVKDAYLKFLRVNKLCLANEDYHSQMIMAQNSKPEDVAMIISYSGESVEMVKCLEYLRRNGTAVISMTRFTQNTVATMATNRLYTISREPLFRSGATASRMAQLNMIDMLYASYITLHYEECEKRFLTTHIEKPNL